MRMAKQMQRRRGSLERDEGPVSARLLRGIAEGGRRRRGPGTDRPGSIADVLPPATREAFDDLLQGYDRVLRALGEERETLLDETTLPRST